MVERRQRANAHEFTRADLNYSGAGLVMEMRNDSFRHATACCLRFFAIAPHHNEPTG